MKLVVGYKLFNNKVGNIIIIVENTTVIIKTLRKVSDFVFGEIGFGIEVKIMVQNCNVSLK
jgi:hypothetical protein